MSRPAAPLLLLPRSNRPRFSFEWSGSVMRFDKRFCARTAVTAGLLAAAVSVFGLSPVHAQTTPAMPPAAQPGSRPPHEHRRCGGHRARAEPRSAGAAHQSAAARSGHRRVQGELHAELHVDASNLVDQTQPPSSLLSGNTSQLTNGRIDLRLRRPAADAVVRRRVPGAVQQRPHHHEQHLHELRSAADVEHQRHLHAAAAAQLQDRRHAPAAAGQPEEPGDLATRSCSSRSRRRCAASATRSTT